MLAIHTAPYTYRVKKVSVCTNPGVIENKNSLGGVAYTEHMTFKSACTKRTLSIIAHRELTWCTL